MKVELHCHSLASDGSYEPAEVAKRAAQAGVELFALTDHDTIAGVNQAHAAVGAGVTTIVALEVSCTYGQRGLHVLTYLPPGRDPSCILDIISQQGERRRQRILAIGARLKRLGAPIDCDALLEARGGQIVGRVDVARALVAAGHVKTLKLAFARFLRDGGPADVPLRALEFAELSRWSEKEGARLSLAHPHTVDSYELCRELLSISRVGCRLGIEAFYGPYGAAAREPWLRLASELGLVMTGGSHFHGDAKPEVLRPGIELPQEIAVETVRWLCGDSA